MTTNSPNLAAALFLTKIIAKYFLMLKLVIIFNFKVSNVEFNYYYE